MSARVRAERACFAFEGNEPLLTDVTFQLEPGWTGLVGENGSGKTTLLRLLTGELLPTSGALRRLPDEARVHLCLQSVETLPPEVRALAEDPGAEGWTWMGRLSLEPDSLGRWESLSPGERKRWQLAAALTSAPDVLLVDEPTNHLDAPARDEILSALRRFRGVGLVVSHDRDVLNALTTRTLRVARGEAQLWPGPYDDARRAWLAEEAQARAARAEAKEEVERLERRLVERRQARAAAGANRSTGKRMRSRYDSDARGMGADFRVAMAEKRLGRDVEVVRRARDSAQTALDSHAVVKEVGRAVQVAHARAARPRLLSLEQPRLERGGRTLLEDLSLTVPRDARIWLSGPNGAGKSTLIDELLRASTLPEDSVLHLPQELGTDEVTLLLARTRALPADERGRVLGFVAALGLEPDTLLATASPSPGEARKLALAWGLGRGVGLLVLDEPTNHLDLPSVERLEVALAEFPGALLLTTHDARFARACTSTEWRLEGGRVVERDVEPA